MEHQMIRIADGITPLQLPPDMLPITPVLLFLSRMDRQKLQEFIETGIELLDLFEPDPDAEGQCTEDEVSSSPEMGAQFMPKGPGCDLADSGEFAWVEWTSMRGSQKRGPNIACEHEDSEEDDPAGVHDEDGANTLMSSGKRSDGPGCTISDPDFCLASDDRGSSMPPANFGMVSSHIYSMTGEPEDYETEQLPNDVPMLGARDLDGNNLGIVNMQSSFVTNGTQVRSADSGQHYRSKMEVSRQPGSPV